MLDAIGDILDDEVCKIEGLDDLDECPGTDHLEKELSSTPIILQVLVTSFSIRTLQFDCWILLLNEQCNQTVLCKC